MSFSKLYLEVKTNISPKKYTFLVLKPIIKHFLGDF